MASLNELQTFLRPLADVLFPPRCPSCRANVAADGNFCAACFSKLHLIAPPMCAQCGIPFVVAAEAGALCPSCLDTPPHYDRIRAVMVYDAISAPLITALKFHDQWAGLARHCDTMLAAAGELMAQVDMIIPVPLHWRRLAQRRFNQSALLAYGISARTGIACAPDILARIRHTTPQMRLDRATRQKNVKKAFAVESAQAHRLQDKIVLLVDDVVTTGATADACAATLKKAGAREVRVLALARTVKE